MRILKWSGNKAPMAPKILELLGPVDRWSAYFEPFAGSLAVLEAARAAGYAGPVTVAERHRMIRAFLRGMSIDPESIADTLAELPRMHITNAVYEAVRAEFNAMRPSRSSFAFCARFIWLNRAGFNGLFRTNGDGAFNVAWGGKAVLSLPTAGEIEAFGRCILYADVEDDWKILRQRAKRRGARVYCDPPYVGTHTYGSKWTREDRQALAMWAAQLVAAGARVVISELDTPEAREDFATLEFVPTASVYSSISVKAATRGQRNEALWVGGSL